MCLPVVATNIRGCRNLVIDRKTGLLIPPKNSEELTKTLLKLINNRGLRKKYGKAGRAYSERNFCNKIVIERMMTGYSYLLKL